MSDKAPSAPAKSILLVDDQDDTLRATQKLLQREGYSVTIARDVKSALEVGSAIRFNLLITDIGLPDGDGRKLLAQLRKMYPLPGIALSGYGMKEDVDQTAQMDFDAHLTKPISLENLRAAIQHATGSPAPAQQ